MVLLSMQNVTKSFGLNVVLKNINMTLKEGQKMGLVGVNGSGKSTLLKLIPGSFIPTRPILIRVLFLSCAEQRWGF